MDKNILNFKSDMLKLKPDCDKEHIRTFFKTTELSYILVMVVVTQLYALSKFRTVHQKECMCCM